MLSKQKLEKNRLAKNRHLLMYHSLEFVNVGNYITNGIKKNHFFIPC